MEKSCIVVVVYTTNRIKSRNIPLVNTKWINPIYIRVLFVKEMMLKMMRMKEMVLKKKEFLLFYTASA